MLLSITTFGQKQNVGDNIMIHQQFRLHHNDTFLTCSRSREGLMQGLLGDILWVVQLGRSTRTDLKSVLLQITY